MEEIIKEQYADHYNTKKNWELLASAVIGLAALDIKNNKPIDKKTTLTYRQRAKNDVLAGRLDLFFDLLNLDYTREEFIKRSEKLSKDTKNIQNIMLNLSKKTSC